MSFVSQLGNTVLNWVDELRGRPADKEDLQKKSPEQNADVQAAKAKAAADAALKQQAFEEEAVKGRERVRLKRRKGYQSTVLAGDTPLAGGQGNTLLGQ